MNVKNLINILFLSLISFTPYLCFGMEKYSDSKDINYCYESYDQLKQDLENKGYNRNELIHKITNDVPFPSSQEQITLDWYPHNYFRKHGGYDGLSTFDVTLLNLHEASNKKAALDYCNHSVFMTSYREIIEKVFYLLEQSPQHTTICLPAGGIPYYVPREKNIVVYDTDKSLEKPLKSWPNSKAVLGEEGDVYKINGKYDIICCMGFSFYLKSLAELKKLITILHEHLEDNGTLMLNFIFSNAGVDGNGQKLPNFEKALQWNMDIIHQLNPNPIFNALFLTKDELLNACGNMFEPVEIYSGSLHVHGLAILKKC